MLKEKDCFKQLIQSSLEEEVKDITFSEKMKNKVYQDVVEKKRKVKWFDRKISFSMAQFMVIVSIFTLVIGFYGKTVFYISDIDREKICQESKDIIIKQGNIPFAAVQNLVYDIEEGGELNENEETEHKS